MKFTEEDKLLVRKLVEIKNKGYYCNGQQLTSVYNRVLEKNVNNTNCGSCMRQRISELDRALKQWEAQEAQNKAQEALKQEDPTPTKAEEKEAAQAADNEMGSKGKTESVPLDNIKKRGRPKKKE